MGFVRSVWSTHEISYSFMTVVKDAYGMNEDLQNSKLIAHSREKGFWFCFGLVFFWPLRRFPRIGWSELKLIWNYLEKTGPTHSFPSNSVVLPLFTMASAIMQSLGKSNQTENLSNIRIVFSLCELTWTCITFKKCSANTSWSGTIRENTFTLV